MSPIRALSAPLLFAAASVLLPAGTRLHLAPDVTSMSVAIVDEPVELVPEGARDGWVLVRYDGRRGWVKSDLPTPLLETLLATIPTVVPEAPQDLLAGPVFPSGRGRDLLADRWRIRSDVEDEELLERIRGSVGLAPERFKTWWKLAAKSGSGDVVLLFSRNEDARRFDPLACGRIRNGVVTASVVPGDPDATVRRVLHQVGHLYVRSPAPRELDSALARGGARRLVRRDRREGGRPPGAALPRSTPETGARRRTSRRRDRPRGGPGAIHGRRTRRGAAPGSDAALPVLLERRVAPEVREVPVLHRRGSCRPASPRGAARAEDGPAPPAAREAPPLVSGGGPRRGPGDDGRHVNGSVPDDGP